VTVEVIAEGSSVEAAETTGGSDIVGAAVAPGDEEVVGDAVVVGGHHS
jgi:hypothetical protein